MADRDKHVKPRHTINLEFVPDSLTHTMSITGLTKDEARILREWLFSGPGWPWEEPVYSVQLPLCPLPPPGWVCTRGAGHDGQGGPCAAILLPNTVRLLPVVLQTGQNSCTKEGG